MSRDDEHEVALESFLRGAWRSIPSDEALEWVQRVVLQPSSGEPCGDYGDVVRRLLALGAEPADIARLARIAAYEAVFSLCYQLEDSAVASDQMPEAPDWGLFRLVDGEPAEPMQGLHEYLLATDPTGREMRPPERQPPVCTGHN